MVLKFSKQVYSHFQFGQEPFKLNLGIEQFFHRVFEKVKILDSENFRFESNQTDFIRLETEVLFCTLSNKIHFLVRRIIN